MTALAESSRINAPRYPGKSERTLSRQKQAWRKLAAQGFTTLPDFLRQQTEKSEKKARIAALVAATTAAQSRSMQQRPYVLEEEEASEPEDEITAEEDNLNPRIASTFRIYKHTPETSATSDMAQPRGLEGTTTSCVIEISSESEPSCTVSRSSSESREIAHRPCWQASFEESEESSGSCGTLSDDDNPDSDSESDCLPSKIQCKPDDPQGIARRLEELLEELRCRNASNNVALKSTVLGCIQDCAGLHVAREQLAALVGDKKMDSILRGRVHAMVGLLLRGSWHS